MQLTTVPQNPQIYQICIREYLDDDVAEWFRPLTSAHEPDGATTLTGPVRDQAELHGLISKVRDLNLTLLFVRLFQKNSCIR